MGIGHSRHELIYPELTTDEMLTHLESRPYDLLMFYALTNKIVKLNPEQRSSLAESVSSAISPLNYFF